MLNKKHILFLTSWYPDKFHPLNGNFIRKHALAVSRYVTVTVIYARSDVENKKIFVLTHNKKDDFNEIIVYYKGFKHLFFRRIFHPVLFFAAHLKAYFYAVKKISKIEFTVVNVFAKVDTIALLYKFFFGIKYCIIEHWTGYSQKRFKLTFLKKIIASTACAIISVSYDLADTMQKCGLKNANYMVINNVVSKEYFVDYGMRKKSPKQIIVVSNFKDEHKNISGILRVIKTLKIRYDINFGVAMVGIGNDIENLKKYAAKLGITDTVDFVGMKSELELAKLLQQSCCLVLFSNYENSPVVIPEAFACGIPVIATDVGGISEHLDSDKGILIPAKDEKQLEMAIKKLLENDDMFDIDKIKQYSTKFTDEYVGKQIVEIILSCL